MNSNTPIPITSIYSNYLISNPYYSSPNRNCPIPFKLSYSNNLSINPNIISTNFQILSLYPLISTNIPISNLYFPSDLNSTPIITSLMIISLNSNSFISI